MTREEAKTVFLNRGYVEVDNGTYYSPDKWREACVVISEWLEQQPKEICNKWGDGCKTKEDGYCFLFEPKESEGKNDARIQL